MKPYELPILISEGEEGYSIAVAISDAESGPQFSVVLREISERRAHLPTVRRFLRSRLANISAPSAWPATFPAGAPAAAARS